MITRFDRHLLAEWSKTFVFSVLMISIILMASTQLLTWIATVSDSDIPLKPATLLLLYQLPGILLYAVPMGSLCASLVSVSQLNQQLAIVSVRAMGISIPRLIQPIIGISLLLSLASIGINEYGVAPSNQAAERITQQFTQTVRIPAVHYQSFDSAGYLKYSLHASTNPQTPTTLHNATLIEYAHTRIVRMTYGAMAQWRDPYWEFRDGIQFDIEPRRIQSQTVSDPWTSPLTTPPHRLQASDTRAEQLNSQDLKAQIQHKQATGRFSRDDQFNLHVKFSLPFTTLTFAVIGALMSISFQRTRSMVNVGVGVGIIIAYYVLLSITMGLCLLGWLHPIVAAWTPNTALMGISLLWYQIKVRA